MYGKEKRSKTMTTNTTTMAVVAGVVPSASSRMASRRSCRRRFDVLAVAAAAVGMALLSSSSSSSSFVAAFVVPATPTTTTTTTRRSGETTTSIAMAAVVGDTSHGPSSSSSSSVATATVQQQERQRREEKRKLLGLVSAPPPYEDPVLADPVTKHGVTIRAKSTVLLGGSVSRRSSPRISYELKSPTDTYGGTSDTFYNLLEPIKNTDNSDNAENDSDNGGDVPAAILRTVTPLIPPPLRSALATAGLPVGSNYVPMRDLFTSPSVSFAYERGWRQGFVAAGFPGPDRESEMAMEYFEPAVAMSDTTKVLVDMSCATGLFTRRFAKSGRYDRVLGCDYSESMLTEARRRIRSDPELNRSDPNDDKKKKTQLDLVRLDVGRIPFKDGSVDVLHAGAAMHCWPDLPAAVSEIHRVLKPGGRYFATTFLSSYFGTLQAAEGGETGPSRQAFQYFESVDQLRSLLEEHGGFDRDKIVIEVLGTACVVIRAEK